MINGFAEMPSPTKQSEPVNGRSIFLSLPYEELKRANASGANWRKVLFIFVAHTQPAGHPEFLRPGESRENTVSAGSWGS